MIKNQKGFTGLEVVLIVVTLVAIGAAGYFAFQAREENDSNSAQSPQKNEATTTKSSDSSNQPAKESDENLITNAVNNDPAAKQYGFRVTGKIEIVGSSARGRVAGQYNSGLFYAYKSDGKWIPVGVGAQDYPTQAEINQYGFPQSWINTQPAS